MENERDRNFMKNKKQKWMCIVFLLFLGFSVVFPNITVKAKSEEGYIDIEKNFKQTITCSSADKKEGYFLGIDNVLPKNATEIKVTSSNKSVAGIRKGKWGANFYLKPKKTGTTRVVVSAVVGTEKVNYTGTVKVVNFKNPFKTLKINGKNYSKQVKGSNNYIEIKKSKIKLNYKLKSGWKIESKDAYGFKQKK